MPADRTQDFGSVAIAALLVLFGAVVIWETTTYVDFDSAVFPRTAAIAMVLFCLLYIVLWLAGLIAPRAEETEPGSWPRRIALVASMLATALAMPWLGFVPSALLSFAALTIIAMYEPWTGRRAAIYALVGIAVVIGFYVLFALVLRVPLPAGQIFAG